MAVSHEIKSQLAKLLATEDLIVEHKHVDTAQFNVHTRVLTLPLWDRASNILYDLLVGHEVGHALFTPDDDWLQSKKITLQFVNVFEYARIEKLMKRKYPGISKSFFGGYKELFEKDFFEIDGEDITTFNFADRANLYFKIGNFVNIKFDNHNEMSIIRMISECEDFEDVLVAAEFLYKYCKKKGEEKRKSLQPPQMNGSSDNSSFNDDFDIKSISAEGCGSQIDQRINSYEQLFDDLEIHTAESLEEKLKDLTAEHCRDNIYVEIPKLNLDSVIVSNTDVHNEIETFFGQNDEIFIEKMKQYCIENDMEMIYIYEKVDSEFNRFKKSAQKEVNYLVKEFECKKAADSYSRATTARTGVLDCTKLHSYKYNEDLFKKVTNLPDGKNHGLVFIIDWSGSMSHVLLDTLKQLYNLVWFCRKVSIPFDVYAFTNEWNRTSYDYVTGRYNTPDIKLNYEKKEGLLYVDDTFSLMNLLSSKVKSKTLEKQMVNIWRIASYYSEKSSYAIPQKLSLSGTPLNEALVALHQILPKFKSDYKLQKVQTIILTDGEASQIPYHVEVNRPWENRPYLGTRHVPYDLGYLRDRKLGTLQKIGNNYHEFTDTLLKNLKNTFPVVNFIGIRVVSPREASYFIKNYYPISNEEYGKVYSDWRKNKSFCIKKSGYDAYFGLSSTVLSDEYEFEVEDDATKAQIKKAFTKSLTAKKMNKQILSRFIELIA